MKLSRRSLHLALAVLALAGVVASRALWLAPMTMLWSATARAEPPIVSGRLKPYQQFGQNATLCTGGNCTVDFPAVAAETLISQVTCYFFLSNTYENALAELTDGVGYNFLPIAQTSTYNGYIFYVINAQTQYFFSSGQQPQVYVGGNGGEISQLQCSVSGYSGSALLATAALPTARALPPTPAALPPSPGLPVFTRVPAQ
jgi:hypothetical protein